MHVNEARAWSMLVADVPTYLPYSRQVTEYHPKHWVVQPLSIVVDCAPLLPCTFCGESCGSALGPDPCSSEVAFALY